MAFNLGVVVWAGANALQAAATTLDAKLLWVNVQYLGIAAVPPASFAFAARDELATPRRIGALAAPMAALVVLSWTNEFHGLVRSAEALTTVGGVVTLERSFGPAFWVGWGYLTLLNLAATALLLRAVLHTRDLYRRQVAALVGGACVPWAAQLLLLAGFSPFEPESFFAVTGAAFVYAVTRYRFLDLLPVARETLIETLDDGIMVLDERGRVVDLNAAAREVLGDSVSVGATAETAFGPVPALLAAYRAGDGGKLVLDDDGRERRFDVRVSSLTGTGRRVVVLRDVTPLAERERELERKNRRLEEFATLLSHDLRGPLSVASGYVDPERGERDSKRLERAAEALGRMDDIIDGLLTLAREDQPIETVNEVELAELARTAWGHVDTGDARLVVDADRAVEADPERLLRALENLFRNAVEHGSTSPPSQAQGDAVEHGDALEVRIGDLPGGFYIADDGTGFDADPDELFEWGFSTGEGTGLGLAVVRRVVEAHGWAVRAARFEVTGVDRRAPTAVES